MITTCWTFFKHLSSAPFPSTLECRPSFTFGRRAGRPWGGHGTLSADSPFVLVPGGEPSGGGRTVAMLATADGDRPADRRFRAELREEIWRKCRPCYTMSVTVPWKWPCDQSGDGTVTAGEDR